MANKVLTRVWEHSQTRGAARCLMLAIADVADEHGIAYPGAAYLAQMINEDEDYTRKLLRKVIEDGEIVHRPGGGRGRKTLYAVAIGLTDAQRAKQNSVLQSRVYSEKKHKNPALQSGVSQNPALQSGVSELNPALQNTVFKGPKPCTNDDLSQSGSEASGPGESRSAPNMIHDPWWNHDPPPPESVPTPARESGGGGGDSIEEEPTETERYLLQERFGKKAAYDFRHFDLAACRLDIKESRAQGSGNGAIIKRWYRVPPKPAPPPTAPAPVVRPPDRNDRATTAQKLRALQTQLQLTAQEETDD